MANENSGVQYSLDSLKEEDEWDKMSINSNMSAGTIATINNMKKIRSSMSGSGKRGKEKEKDELLNYEDDVNELHRSFMQFITIFDAQR